MFNSVVWEFIGKFLNQILAFVISVILARLLLPNEFGLVGIILVFVAFAGVFFDFGFRNAIINQQNISENALSTVFYINLSAAVLVAAIFFIAAKPIASFYHEPALEMLLKFATILFITNAASLVPVALNQKKLKFRANAVITTTATVVSGIVSVWMAYKGWGVWSILFRNLIQSLLTCGFSWFICKWIPRLIFDTSSIKPFIAYSSSLFLTGVVDSMFLRADVLVIGKQYNSSILGYYTRAQTLESVSRDLTSGIIYSVFFPYFSKIKDDLNEVRLLYTKCLHVVSFTLLSLNGILFLNAKQIVVVLLTTKWIASIVFFKFFLVIGFFFTMNVIMGTLIASTGNYKIFLRSEFFRKLILVPAYVFGFYGNIQIFLFSLIVSYIFMLFLNMIYTNRITCVNLKQQLVIILRYLIPSAFSTTICWLIFEKKLGNPFVHIAVVSFAYTIFNVLLNVLFNNKGLKILYSKLPFHSFRHKLKYIGFL